MVDSVFGNKSVGGKTQWEQLGEGGADAASFQSGQGGGIVYDSGYDVAQTQPAKQDEGASALLAGVSSTISAAQIDKKGWLNQLVSWIAEALGFDANGVDEEKISSLGAAFARANPQAVNGLCDEAFQAKVFSQLKSQLGQALPGRNQAQYDAAAKAAISGILDVVDGAVAADPKLKKGFYKTFSGSAFGGTEPSWADAAQPNREILSSKADELPLPAIRSDARVLYPSQMSVPAVGALVREQALDSDLSSGDCSTAPSLSALAETDKGKKILKRAVRSNADGSYTVTLQTLKFDEQGNVVRGTERFRVSGRLSDGDMSTRRIWAPLIKKAMAVQAGGDFGKLDGIGPPQVLSAAAGYVSSYCPFGGAVLTDSSGLDTQKRRDSIQALRNYKTSDAVVLAMPQEAVNMNVKATFTDAHGKSYEQELWIKPAHIYQVCGVQPDGTVLLRDASASSSERGLFSISWQSFMDCYKGAFVASAPQSL